MHFENLQNGWEIGKTKNDFCYFNQYLYTCRLCIGARSNIVRLVQIWCRCNNLWKLFFSEFMSGLEALLTKIRQMTIHVNYRSLVCQAVEMGPCVFVKNTAVC